MRGYVISARAPLEAFRTAARAAGLAPTVTFAAEGTRPYEEAWANANRSVVLQYVDQQNLELHYFFLRGDPTLEALLMSSLVQDLDYVNREEILEDAKHATDPDDRVIASNRLAVAETDFDPEVLDLLTRFTTDADEVARTAATRAFTYLRWPAARPLLEKLLAEDPSEWVRNAAKEALSALDEATTAG